MQITANSGNSIITYRITDVTSLIYPVNIAEMKQSVSTVYSFLNIPLILVCDNNPRTIIASVSGEINPVYIGASGSVFTATRIA